VRPFLHPYLVNELVITAPGNTGGANQGPLSFSPRTGLLYVTGKNDAFSIKVKPVGDTVRPGVPAIGFRASIAEHSETGMTPSATVAAYDPATGRQAWYTELPRTTNSGNFVTGGDLVFQGVGSDFYALDARSGQPLFKSTLKTPSRASAMTYQVNGRQYVTIVDVNTVVTFGLPEASPAPK
jgi:alcohol dehydrogenase (cytochrome c)